MVGLEIDDDDSPAFWFLESGENSPETTVEEEEEDDDDRQALSDRRESNKAFWDEQHKILEATLYRTSSVETKVRRATKEVLKELSGECQCGKRAKGCENCRRREVREGLERQGWDCQLCVSKSRSHTYLEVLVQGSKRLIVDLDFRAEFQMAVDQDYHRLVARLPEVYVGKAERLRDVVAIVCAAAKRCMKERNMHLGPWRKRSYVQSKWLGVPCPAPAPALPPLPLPITPPAARPRRASLLTFDLSEPAPKAVAV